jgi:hypothetical protein
LPPTASCELLPDAPAAAGDGRVGLANSFFTQEDGNLARLAIACRALGYSLYIAGEPIEAAELLDRGATLADGLADAEFAIYGELPQIICRLYHGMVRCVLGYPEEAARNAEEGLARARARNNPHALAWALVVTGNVHNFRRDASAAERLGAEAMEVSREHRLPQWLALAQAGRGWACASSATSIRA